MRKNKEQTLFVTADAREAILGGLQKHIPRLFVTGPDDTADERTLCFNAQGCQRAHPGLFLADTSGGKHNDADAIVTSPMLLGVADGVESLEDFGIDAAELPHELLNCCQELAMSQLLPERPATPFTSYGGPIELLKEAYEATESLGSTTVLLAIMDNRTRIHGKLRPMLAVLTVGDCELVVLRRRGGRHNPLEVVFHTESEVERVRGVEKAPIQVARVDDRIDPEFDDGVALDVIERASMVSCVTILEHDIVLLGSDGVFDNLFLEELVDICNDFMPRGATSTPVQPMILRKIAERIVSQSHSKTRPTRGGDQRDAPIGKGGKMDDTAVVVAEIIEWTEEVGRAWSRSHGNFHWTNCVTCNGGAGDAWVFSDAGECGFNCKPQRDVSCLFYESDDDSDIEGSEVRRKLLVDI